MAKGDWWLKLEIHTWLNDPKGRKLKRENRDSWLTACMLMTLDGSAELSGTPDELSNALHLTLTEFYDFIHDLENTNTADVTRCHAVSRNGLEVVTLKSRRYERDLSIKEKNRLRKQKERGHAVVTPESRDRVKSKEKEVKSNEEREEAHALDCWLEGEAVAAYRRYFPGFELSIPVQEQIVHKATDQTAWCEALDFWKTNNYREQSVGKMLNKHDEILKERINGTNIRTNGKRSDQQTIAESADFYDNWNH